ncbi:MAG TPA: sugar ABC transporter substrate-binding protein [Clostridia bacterium]|nr:sugar ABC transporter substrate-binding protein [Clostridia bacterium]
MKKIFLLGCILIFIASSFVGCYGERSAENSISPRNKIKTSGSNDSKEKTRLILWCYYEGANRFQKVADICNKFNTSNKDLEVIPEYIPFADINKQLLIGYSSGRAPDLAIIDNPVHAVFAAQGMLSDITDKIGPQIDQNLYFKAPWESCVYKGRLYGLPLGNNCLALFYNKDMLQTAGIEPPKSWSELEIITKKLTNGTTYGIGIAAPLDDQGTFQFLPWLLSTGASIETLNSPEGIKAFDFLAKLIKEGVMSKDVMNWTPSDELSQFITGKIAMMVNGPWQIPELKTQAPNLNYGVIDIPEI